MVRICRTCPSSTRTPPRYAPLDVYLGGGKMRTLLRKIPSHRSQLISHTAASSTCPGGTGSAAREQCVGTVAVAMGSQNPYVTARIGLRRTAQGHVIGHDWQVRKANCYRCKPHRDRDIGICSGAQRAAYHGLRLSPCPSKSSVSTDRRHVAKSQASNIREEVCRCSGTGTSNAI